MSRQAPLTTQTGKLFIVIRKNKSIPLDKIKAYCLTYGKEYAFIEHKQDIDPVTGLVIPTHYHIVLNAKDVKKRLATHLNDLVSFFDFDNANGVEIDKYKTLSGALQYLTHQNQKEKTQHKVEEINHNFDVGEFATYMTCDNDVLSFERVYSVCLSAHNIIEVIRELGLSVYQRYRATIWDILDYLRQGQDKKA